VVDGQISGCCCLESCSLLFLVNLLFFGAVDGLQKHEPFFYSRFLSLVFVQPLLQDIVARLASRY